MQVLDLATRADAIREELLGLATQAAPLAAAQAAEQSACLAAKQSMLGDPIQLPALQGEHTFAPFDDHEHHALAAAQLNSLDGSSV